jgi:hypothetical protein
MRHDAADRLDQLANGPGVRRVLVDRNHDQPTELVLTPVIEHGGCQRAREADHHHGSNLLPERHPARA